MIKLNSWLVVLAGIFFLQACQNRTIPDVERRTIGAIQEHRPLYHFTPPSGWMNDPNGMVFYKGEYHLFYQHYPDSTIWGPMHWGHAISRDMVRWEHLPIALYPDSVGYIFSGSAIADVSNSSGLGTAENPPLVAVFTYHDPEGERQGRTDYQSQGIAFSTDQGRTWTKYEGNPVLKSPGIPDFRDPKVFWYEPGRYWVMILAVKDRVQFYRSPNLKDWTLSGEFGAAYGAHGGVWECPDLFELPIEGTEGHRAWVLLLSINPGGPNGGSATQYFVGTFDGNTFTSAYPPQTIRWLDEGKDNYAGVTWSDIPQADGRRLFIGWMSNWIYAQVVPTQTWRSALTVPRSLHLTTLNDSLFVRTWPVAELEVLFGPAQKLPAEPPLKIDGVLSLTELAGWTGPAFDANWVFVPGQGTTAFGVELSNEKGELVRIGYRPNPGQYFINRQKAGKTTFSNGFPREIVARRIGNTSDIPFRLLADVASAELFADGGLTTMTAIFFPNQVFTRISLFAEGGIVEVRQADWKPLLPDASCMGPKR